MHNLYTEEGVPLQCLFHDDAQAGDLVGTGSVPLEACLLFSLWLTGALLPLRVRVMFCRRQNCTRVTLMAGSRWHASNCEGVNFLKPNCNMLRNQCILCRGARGSSGIISLSKWSFLVKNWNRIILNKTIPQHLTINIFWLYVTHGALNVLFKKIAWNIFSRKSAWIIQSPRRNSSCVKKYDLNYIIRHRLSAQLSSVILPAGLGKDMRGDDVVATCSTASI